AFLNLSSSFCFLFAFLATSIVALSMVFFFKIPFPRLRNDVVDFVHPFLSQNLSSRLSPYLNTYLVQ
ncbi:unnamed protein product, partial [Sphagnum compactum]